jgi:hypothetical protein
MTQKQPVVLPEDWKSLPSTDLRALEDQFLDEFKALPAKEDRSKDDVARIIAIGNDLKSVREQITETAAAEQAEADALAAAEAELEKEPEEPEAPAEPEEPAEAPAEEAADELEPVVASAKPRKGAVARAAAAAKPADPADVEPVAPRKQLDIVAAGDIRGFAMGQPLEGIKDLAAAFAAKGSAIPSGLGGTTAFPVAQLKRVAPEGARVLTERDDAETVVSTIFAASREARMAKTPEELQAITAAAFGWVTPSENLYDLCQWATVNGLLALPSIQVNRGGVNFVNPASLDYADVFDNSSGSFTYTESQLAANPTKPLLTIAAPTWEDVRLDVFGWGLVLPIPLKSTFPELIQWWMETAAIAYQHKLNANVINRVLAYLGSALNGHARGAASTDLLELIEVRVQAFRYKYKLAPNATVEGMAPMWLKAAFRIDLSRRNGYANPLDVTDAQIEAWFRSRGVAFQYVYDWAGQDLDPDDMVLPDTVDVGFWVPGTYVRGGGDIISLDAIYDSTRIVKNEYVAAFFEESVLVANVCGEGELVTLPLHYFGLSGAPIQGEASFS